MTTDDVLAAIKAADMAYVAWLAVQTERCRRPETDPYGDEVAAMKTKYVRRIGLDDSGALTIVAGAGEVKQ